LRIYQPADGDLWITGNVNNPDAGIEFRMAWMEREDNAIIDFREHFFLLIATHK
jgi:hypothetical protein